MANKNYRSHTKSRGAQAAIASLLIILIAGGIVLGVGFGVYGTDTSTWFKPQTNVSDGSEDNDEVYEIVQAEDNGIALFTSRAVRLASGNDQRTLTAVVKPENAAQSVRWSVSFKDASSTWATGKDANDYIGVEYSLSDTHVATVTCKQAFGEQIIIKVESTVDANKYATATCDYKAHISPEIMSQEQEYFIKIESATHDSEIELYPNTDNYPNNYSGSFAATSKGRAGLSLYMDGIATDCTTASEVNKEFYLRFVWANDESEVYGWGGSGDERRFHGDTFDFPEQNFEEMKRDGADGDQIGIQLVRTSDDEVMMTWIVPVQVTPTSVTLDNNNLTF